MKLTIQCDWCGKEFERDECQIKGKKHLFCSKQCLATFSSKSKNPNGYKDLKPYANISKHMTELNKELNTTRMTKEVRSKLRKAHLGKGECSGYSKIYGKLAHRVIVEEMIGRKLTPEEVVHHRDGDKYNNSYDNLVVFPSVGEHTKYHNELRWFIRQLEKLEAQDGKE